MFKKILLFLFILINFVNSKESTMKIILNDKEYIVDLDNNLTTKEIIKKLPLKLTFTKYANHEYYSELPFIPIFDGSKYSKLKEGHIYYWDGWNSFVINYIDYDISPYKVVHIGEIKDKSITELLKNGKNNIDIIINK